jgi:predicted GNAT superfamily acetyltransferase
LSTGGDVITKATPAPTVRLLRTVPEFEDAGQVLCEAFNTDSALDLINTSMMVALAMSDNYVAGVFVDDELAGVVVGWRGHEGHLHSHIAGVHPKHQGSGLGYQLKMHERGWARARGLSRVEWTFDPLVRRNAYFNLCKLGTRVLRYFPDFYGELGDGLNSGDDTDRLLVEWDIRPGDRRSPGGRAQLRLRRARRARLGNAEPRAQSRRDRRLGGRLDPARADPARHREPATRAAGPGRAMAPGGASRLRLGAGRRFRGRRLHRGRLLRPAAAVRRIVRGVRGRGSGRA